MQVVWADDSDGWCVVEELVVERGKVEEERANVARLERVLMNSQALCKLMAWSHAPAAVLWLLTGGACMCVLLDGHASWWWWCGADERETACGVNC